jgi:hypothetical protein
MKLRSSYQMKCNKGLHHEITEEEREAHREYYRAYRAKRTEEEKEIQRDRVVKCHLKAKVKNLALRTALEENEL